MEKHVSIPLVLVVVVLLFIMNYWHTKLDVEVPPANVNQPIEEVENGSGH